MFKSRFSKTTILLLSLIATAFIVFSSQWFFANEAILMQLGFSQSHLENIFFFSFIHSGYSHLLANFCLILAAGIALKGNLNGKEILLLFFFGAFVSATVFIALNPESIVMGSSAGAFALLAAAVILEPKKTFESLIVLGLLAVILTYSISFFINSEKQVVSQEISAFEEQKQQAIKDGNTTAIVIAEKKIAEKTMQKNAILEGEQTISKIPVNLEIHLFSILAGTIGLYLLRKKMFLEKTRQHIMIVHRAFGMK